MSEHEVECPEEAGGDCDCVVGRTHNDPTCRELHPWYEKCPVITESEKRLLDGNR